MLFDEEIKGAIESLLFITNTPLSLHQLAELVQIEEAEVQAIVAQLQEQYNATTHGICIVKRAGGYVMATKAEYKDYVEKLYKPQVSALSQAALETLAIVAYRQPVTKGEMELLRGVSVDSAVNRLLGHDLIEEKGRKDTPGRPIMYGTTTRFLQYFGLNSLDELPKLQIEEELPKEMTLFLANERVSE